MSVFTDNAGAFAATADTSIDMERRSTITLAVQLLVEGRPGRALYEVTRSVQRQARMAGIPTQVGPGCPCGGGRCDR